MNVLYTAEALSTGAGRDGRVATSDGSFALDLAIPKDMGGSGAGTNPEQLFAAGYAACFATAMKLVAPQRNLDVSDASVTAEVGLAPNGAGGFTLDVTLRVELPDHVTPRAAQELLAATHQVCPYSNATRGNIPVNIVTE